MTPSGKRLEIDMKILVTGGLGTVGSGLVSTLSERGHEVLSLDLRLAENQKAFSLRSDVEKPSYVRCDIAHYRQIERVVTELGPFDIVYNCAAEFGRWNGEDHYEDLWATNAVGTKNIIRLQERDRFRLVHFSSSEVYGDWDEVMVESVMDDHPIKQMNDYAMSKWVNELQVHNSRLMHDTETVIVRLFNTYGPGEYYSPYRSVNCRFLYCALNKLPWCVFRGHKRTSTYLPDVIDALSNISNNFIAGTAYNIGGTSLHTIEELSDIILDVTGADPKLVEYAESEALTTKEKRVDCSRAIEDLSLKETVTMREGVERTAEWMKKVYELG
jgi:dTDP-glucose 4,6-dehydratase